MWRAWVGAMRDLGDFWWKRRNVETSKRRSFERRRGCAGAFERVQVNAEAAVLIASAIGVGCNWDSDFLVPLADARGSDRGRRRSWKSCESEGDIR